MYNSKGTLAFAQAARDVLESVRDETSSIVPRRFTVLGVQDIVLKFDPDEATSKVFL